MDLSAYQQELQKSGSLYLRCKVTPQSGKTALRDIVREEREGEEVETWKIHLKAAPEKGKANQELVSLLAKLFSVPKSQVEVLMGKTSRVKIVKLLSSRP